MARARLIECISSIPRPASSVSCPRLAGRRKLSSTERIEPSLRRSMLYVPGSDPKKLQKSHVSSADAICFDLEDSVARAQKPEARKNIVSVLNESDPGARELLVRVNSRPTGLTEDDLAAVLDSNLIEGIVIPKVHSGDDVRWVLDLIRRLSSAEVAGRLRLLASIESARAILNLAEIAQASGQVDTLLFAAEDYCADAGITRTASRLELLYARSAVVTTARAFALASMDMVCVNLDHPGVLMEECNEAKRLGFSCKQAIHPKQVQAINRAFSPSTDAIARAVRIIEQNEENEAAGKGAFGFSEGGGRTMIDAPMILQAQAIIDQAEAFGLEVPWSRSETSSA